MLGRRGGGLPSPPIPTLAGERMLLIRKVSIVWEQMQLMKPMPKNTISQSDLFTNTLSLLLHV